MIERMTKYSFVLLSSQKEEFLQQLQELGVVDITRSEKPVDEHSAALLAEVETLSKEIADITAGCDANLTAMRAKLAELLKKRDEIAPWGSWDRDLLQQLGLDMHFYVVEAKRFNPEWPEQFAIQKVSDDGKKVHFVIVGPNDGFPLRELPAPLLTLQEADAAVDEKEREIAVYSKGDRRVFQGAK